LVVTKKRSGGYDLRKWLIASFSLALTTATSQAQDVEAGESSFRPCLVCHAIGVGAKNKIGPELNGLDGRRAGAVEGFPYYSVGILNSGITWNDATFKEYIQNPKAKIPGTTMNFPGILDEKKVAALWAYIKQFGTDGMNK
jgi:cytochrome c